MLTPVPNDAITFYVEDTFSFDSRANLPPKYPSPSGSGWELVHYPGVFNQGGQILPGQSVRIYILSVSYLFNPGILWNLQMLNTDIRIGLRCLTDPGQPWMGVAPFSPEYGGAANGLVGGGVTNLAMPPSGNPITFPLGAPLTLKVTAPPDLGKTYQLGAEIKMHFSVDYVTGSYHYWIHGAWKVEV